MSSGIDFLTQRIRKISEGTRSRGEVRWPAFSSKQSTSVAVVFVITFLTLRAKGVSVVGNVTAAMDNPKGSSSLHTTPFLCQQMQDIFFSGQKSLFALGDAFVRSEPVSISFIFWWVSSSILGRNTRWANWWRSNVAWSSKIRSWFYLPLVEYTNVRSLINPSKHYF